MYSGIIVRGEGGGSGFKQVIHLHPLLAPITLYDFIV